MKTIISLSMGVYYVSMGKVTEAEGTIKPLLSNNTSKVLTKS